MSEYLKMLHEIEAKKEDLEKRIAEVVGIEVAKFQTENQLAVKEIYISLTNTACMAEPKQYSVTGASVDLDYKP
ncbi:hypothetical protein [Acinetobacter guillouiae]|uniref:hypothetical protein n=1 Tax=Acinetobacter guillouiae TaxID=106649 RepID=UPI0004EF689E|nr:hypothetical protein [Acinetobacter guillouiae]BAP36681.1 hypothetical protein AS4_17410 [Acinetobacter guillouiae]